MHMTDLSVKALQPPEKGQKIHFDDGLRNFGIRLSHGGSRSWVVILGANRSVRTIGRYPELSLRDARAAAKKLLANPLELPEKASSVTFTDALQRYLSDCEGRLAPRTVQEYRYVLERHFPFGGRRLTDLTSAYCKAQLTLLRDRPSEQRHAYVALRAFLNWCEREGHLKENFIGSVPAPAPGRSRDRVLTESELAAVYQRTGETPYPYGPIVQLLILTGQRRGEIASLQWEWVDLEEQLITFPAEAVKNRLQHFVPLEALSVAVFRELPRLSEYVFPARSTRSQSPGHFSGWSKCKKAFDAGLESVAPYTLHDLRRTFASNLAKLSTPVHVTEKLLNHRSGTFDSIVGVYQRYEYLDERRAALRLYEAYLQSLR